MKDYGMCHQCGKPIRDFRWALPDWLCDYCYYSKFGPDEPDEYPKPKDIFTGDYPDGDGSYEFLKEHLYKKPYLYEKSFLLLRDFSIFMRNFTGLSPMLKFLKTDGRPVRKEVRDELIRMGRNHKWLKPQVIEILMLVAWKDIVARYGKRRFSEGYYALIVQMDTEATD